MCEDIATDEIDMGVDRAATDDRSLPVYHGPCRTAVSELTG